MQVSNVVRASKDVVGKDVKNTKDENLGKIEETMLDKVAGRVAYIVLESGGVLGLGTKYFALPWNSINYNKEKDCFILDIDKEKLKNAPGFDKDNWPDMADRQWGQTVNNYFGTKPYWE